MKRMDKRKVKVKERVETLMEVQVGVKAPRTDEAILKEFPDDESLTRWIRLAREKVKFQGLPARICWLGYGQRARIGKVFNDMVAKKKLKAHILSSL